VSATDQAKLISYLVQGGRLYIESVDLAKDLQNTELIQYLGVDFDDDGSGREIEFLYGSAFPLFPELDFYYRGGPDAHYRVDHLTGFEATLLFASDDGYQRMFFNENDVFKVISSSIVLGALVNGNNLNRKPYLVSEIVDCFLDSTLISGTPGSDQLRVEGDFKLYPNPFTQHCNIIIEIDKPSEIRIEIYSLFGELVNEIHSGVLVEGRHQFDWFACDRDGRKSKAGMYFVRFTINGQLFTRSIILGQGS